MECIAIYMLQYIAVCVTFLLHWIVMCSSKCNILIYNNVLSFLLGKLHWIMNSKVNVVSKLKLGRVIQVMWVMFGLGQVSLIQLIKYPGLTQILYRIVCINNGLLCWNIKCAWWWWWKCVSWFSRHLKGLTV